LDAGTLISELKRRRVFRVLVGYGLVAFAVLQIIEPVMHALHLADVTLTYAVLALAVGFPIVVVLAWAFDVNEGRIERTAPTSGPLTGTRLKLVLIGIGIVAATPGVIWYFVWPGHRTSRVETPSTSVQPSIAVLPFADMSPGKDQEYFSDGIAEEILNALAQVEGLQVTGRTSSFSFKGKNEDLREIGQKLGVSAVLEGSVRKAGNRVRITAQVVKVANGFHVWSQAYDRDLTDIFAVQDEIAKAVVDALKVKLLSGAARSPKVHAARDPEAYRLYLLGRSLFLLGTEESTRRSTASLQRAVAIEPSYAPAWALLAAAHSDTTLNAPRVEFEQRAQQALEEAERAITLEPDNEEGYAARGYIRAWFFWDWAGAQNDLARAVALGPQSEAPLENYAGLVQK
jgi:TolB-like protein